MNIYTNQQEFIKTIDKKIVSEASLSRILRHMHDSNFAILTANRGENSVQVNRELNKSLEHDIRSKNYGFVKVEGAFEETLADGTKEVNVEYSYFIPNISMKDALELGAKYKQEAILYGSSEKNTIYLAWINGNIEAIGTGLTLTNIGQAYTRFRRHKFSFEMRYVPHGSIDSMSFIAEVKSLNDAKI